VLGVYPKPMIDVISGRPQTLVRCIPPTRCLRTRKNYRNAPGEGS
jgi:hypothetical protein